MANQKHLDILKQGVLEWNRWRRRESKIVPDLSNSNLHEANLGGLSTYEVYNAINDGVQFTGNLHDDYVDGFNFDTVNFRGANLNNTTFEGSDCTNADFRGATLYNAGFCRTNLYRANFQKADLRKAEFPHANVERAILDEADLRESNFEGVNLRQAKFRKANLSGALLGDTDLFGAEFGEAALIGTSLGGANLHHADMAEANLSSTGLYFTIFSESNVSNADFSNAVMAQTAFLDIDLSKVKGLETVKHQGPSAIGIDTLFRSGGNIPEIFLLSAGVPNKFIEYTRSLINNPIEYYSCFISYSSKDQAFAERLYGDLQGKGVRCWYAPEDLKIGDKFWHRIDESIRLYDKLLVVLSKNSIASSWVENEVMAALEKENKQPGKTVLFPIKLDETVMEASIPWAANMRRARHIGDFRKWKSHDDYQKTFDQLLRDLKAGK